MMLDAVKMPRLLQVLPDAIPGQLRGLDRWVVWQARTKPNGRVDKIPVHPSTRKAVSAQDPANWLQFAEVVAAYDAGVGQGIGIVLDGQPVAHSNDGTPQFLVGVDLDGVDMDALEEPTKAILGELRGTYLEKSPSGQGLRLFALSREKPRCGQGAGGELYAEKRFLTVTGQGARGSIKDCTEGVRAVERIIFPETAETHDNVVRFPAELFELNRRLAGDNWLETDENIARVQEALSFIRPDSRYEIWRAIIWALASLGWKTGPDIASAWSAKSEKHWGRDGGAEASQAIADLFRQYKPDRGVTVGSLLHHAYEGGMPRPDLPSGPLFPLATTPATKGRFRLLSRDELDALPPLGWTVRDVLPETGIAAIYGEPGSGKSFLALDLVAKISSEVKSWFGRPATQRDVVYVALEGGRGVKQRLLAWDAVNERRADKIKVLLEGFNLLNGEHVATFAEVVTAACDPGAVVIIDTLAQATAGADENSAQDMGLVLQAAQAIAESTGGLVVLVHHSGKDASRGLRGHSVLNAAMDAVIAVERDRQTGRRSWRVTKMKDAHDGAAGMFTLEVADLGPDGFGGRLSSCAVRELTGVSAVIAAISPSPRGPHQQAVYDALRGHQDRAKGWSENALIAAAKAALVATPSRHRATRAKAAVSGLIEGGLLRRDEVGIFHLTHPSPDHPSPPPYRGGGDSCGVDLHRSSPFR